MKGPRGRPKKTGKPPGSPRPRIDPAKAREAAAKVQGIARFSKAVEQHAKLRRDGLKRQEIIAVLSRKFNAPSDEIRAVLEKIERLEKSRKQAQFKPLKEVEEERSASGAARYLEQHPVTREERLFLESLQAVNSRLAFELLGRSSIAGFKEAKAHGKEATQPKAKAEGLAINSRAAGLARKLEGIKGEFPMLGREKHIQILSMRAGVPEKELKKMLGL